MDATLATEAVSLCNWLAATLSQHPETQAQEFRFFHP